MVRGDHNSVHIGPHTNVQDRTVIQSSYEEEGAHSGVVKIGEGVTIGHGALITAATIGDFCLIGQGSIISEGAVVESRSMVGAGAVVLAGTTVPSGQLWTGNPAVFKRNLTEVEIDYMHQVYQDTSYYLDFGDLTHLLIHFYPLYSKLICPCVSCFLLECQGLHFKWSEACCGIPVVDPCQRIIFRTA